MGRSSNTRSPTHHFGQRDRARRYELGLSQEALAEAAGMHRTYVGSRERGERNVALLNIVRLAEALELDPLTWCGALPPDLVESTRWSGLAESSRRGQDRAGGT